jgi:GMC oxidoreductase
MHGIAGLSVIDASVMPDILSANTNIPTMAVAEHVIGCGGRQQSAPAANTLRRRAEPETDVLGDGRSLSSGGSTAIAELAAVGPDGAR